MNLCEVCQRVKVGLLQPLPVSELKWDEIGMDFITGFPRTMSSYDAIWVIVHKLAKVAHFLPIKQTYGGAQLVELYMLGLWFYMVYQRG